MERGRAVGLSRSRFRLSVHTTQERDDGGTFSTGSPAQYVLERSLCSKFFAGPDN